jgi:hypothetical protein
MIDTKQKVRLFFNDLSQLRQFKLFVLANKIMVTASSMDKVSNTGFMDCFLIDSEKQTAQTRFNGQVKL